jgi:hypothetical protein
MELSIRKTALQKYITPKVNRPLVHIDEEDMLILLNGMLVEGAVEMYNIVTSSSSPAKKESLEDDDLNWDDIDNEDFVQEATISDKINAYKAILQSRKYISDSLLRSEELDMKRKLKELDDFGDLNLDNNSEVL